MWHYGHEKLRQIGIRGIFAGWGLSFLRDSLGYGIFFSSFEYIKAQAYYAFIPAYYGSLGRQQINRLQTPGSGEKGIPLIRPHYALEPCFLMMAGMVASIAQQAVQHPLSVIQNLHFGRLEYLDHQARIEPSNGRMLRRYYHAYQETYKRCQKKSARAGGWRRWLYRGFAGGAVRQVPSTSAALVIFELVRRKYASLTEVVYIEKDGYKIVL